jgi:hypothetical protein
MFCPNCKTEYRPGFTECSDCRVALVEHLPPADPSDGESPPTRSDGLELLWSGVDPSPYDQICDALEDAGLFHKDTAREVGLPPGWTKVVNFIWIKPGDRASCRSILEKALAEPAAMDPAAELAPQGAGLANPFGLDRTTSSRSTVADNAPSESDELPESDGPDEPLPDDVVEDFDPNDATTEVWSGDDRQTADYLKMSLSGVGVGCVLEKDGGKLRVLVLPTFEKRAREITREVIEGTPPQ